ncbi:hypothetical protein AMIS_49520 [Actinoplanes missouriensis 431]|uniref:Uncharacterized protein n=1 Tax=Actinoplanes missouriensis (strain ATCC 14538 / DSM 43046 / CBS 188.64 / JCM 3121 / NBRC 102363 / NCIMB 12654 / NRRL B-3342 / UNCC 431) TaxID=512565 RepID=I0HAY5_ACTM4|nr:DUF6114 domain-containing protein [Actinoplanes missouriensis]BAL90172.1 hypothetical protein AMIS_49520 [Actinoplanes missouriensis 431]
MAPSGWAPFDGGAEDRVTAENMWGRFRAWRRGRPYWAGFFLVLSGLEMFLSANMALDNIEIHIGPQGFLSYLIPVLMLVSGLLVWFSPAQRLFYGVVGTLTALYSFIGLNLGGWFVGMLLGIVGGALAIAWSPSAPENRPPEEPVHDSGPPTAEIPAVVSDPTIVPGIGAGPQDGDPQHRPAHRSAHRKALLIAPLALAAAVVAGGNVPADAAPECPEGLPSITTTPSRSVSPPAKAAQRKAPKASQSSTATARPSASSASAAPSPSATGEDDDDTGFPILDGIGDALEDIGDGLNDIFNPGQAAPSPSPSPSVAAPPAPSSAAPSSAGPSTVVPSQAPGSSASPTPSRKPDEIPCLGARQEGLVAESDGIPRAGVKPGILRTKSLTMYNSTYEGVVDVPTANGPITSLFFSMDKAVNKPFSLEIAEPNGATTLIKSGELTTDGNVEFYSPKFTGKLFGLIPVTFSPEQPPPLTLPVLWFTDVTIDLAYVQCDVLTAKPISISELP